MASTLKATELLVCFRDKLKNVDLIVGTDHLGEAKKIAKLWAEKHEKKAPTRLIFKQQVSFPYGPASVIKGIKVWPPPF